MESPESTLSMLRCNRPQKAIIRPSFLSRGFLLLEAIPSFEAVHVNVKAIQHPPNTLIHHLCETIRPRIKRGHGWKYSCASSAKEKHVLEMDVRERRFANNHDKLTVFFQRYVGSPRDRIVAQSSPYSRQCLHATGHDNHAVVLERS